MKTYRYECDGGSLLIGNENFACCYMNNFGDGVHRVHVLDRNEKMPSGKWDFVGCVLGKANIYDYDGLESYERAGKSRVLCELSGRYGVYAKKDSGDMLVEYWDDWNC